MSFAFSADEIFALAERIEKNGAEFYRRAAETAACSGARHLLLDIARMEEGHQSAFSQMRKDLADKDRAAATFDPENVTHQYLASLAGSRVFTDPESPVPGASDACAPDLLKRILEFAIGREKDSIAFYTGMKELVATETGKCSIDDIIREEMGHIRVLNNELANLEQK